MYEVHCDCGTSIFENEHDAISALWLVGLYHNAKINREAVHKKLEKYGYYEEFPLSIIKSE